MILPLKLVGLWLFLDGLVSMAKCSDKKWTFQIVRVIRAVLGIALILVKP